MSPAFLASLTLGALVAWLGAVLRVWCKQRSRLAEMAEEIASVPMRFAYAYDVAKEAFQEANPPTWRHPSPHEAICTFWIWPFANAKEAYKTTINHPAASAAQRDRFMKHALILSMFGAAIAMGGWPTPTAEQPIPRLRVVGKRSGGRCPSLPWKQRRFRAMRGIATPDWQHGEPLYPQP